MPISEKRQNMNSTLKKGLLKLIAFTVCTVPPIVATLTYFPLWKSRGGMAVISGFTVLLILISAYPLVKALKRVLSSPSIFTVWLFLFLTFALIRSIAYEMTVISFVGFLSNLIGACLFRLARREVKNENSS